MTYLSSNGTGNYASMSYGAQLRQSEQDRQRPEHSWYQSGSANPGYSAGINSVAETYMKTPCCGNYPSIGRFV